MLNKCKDCRYYRPLSGYWQKYAYCNYSQINPFNHVVEVQGNLAWNEIGKCRKFQSKEHSGSQSNITKNTTAV